MREVDVEIALVEVKCRFDDVCWPFSPSALLISLYMVLGLLGLWGAFH